MAAVDEEYLERLIWRRGRPAEMWVRYVDKVQALIEKSGLEAISQEHLIPSLQTRFENRQVEEADPALVQRRWVFPGGLRFPHVHYKADIYRLSSRQWKEFTAEVLGDFQERLSAAKSVSFDQMLDIAEAVDSLV